MEERARTASRTLLTAAVALLALLVPSSSAVAQQDELKGGSVILRLQSSHGLKLKPASLSLPITGGAVDPIDGSGTVKVSGAMGAKLGKGKTTVTIVSLTFGPGGAPGSVAATVGKGKGRKRVNAFGVLRGGTVVRDGWGARIDGVTASIASKGAQSLNRVLSSRGRRGAMKYGGGRVRSGQPLATVSALTVPRTVAVVPGSGTMTLNTPLAFATKLLTHCIDAASAGGVAAIGPATQSITTFSFPVSGGAIAPDFSDGKIQTAGGQSVSKNNGLAAVLYPSCTTAAPPVGTTIVQNDFAADLGIESLTAHALPPGTDLGVGAVGTFDLSGASMTLDPATGQVTISNVGVNLTSLAANVLNSLFPNESGNPSNDFGTSDSLGTLNVTAKLH